MLSFYIPCGARFSNTTQGNYQISSCLFLSLISASNNGGAVYIYQANSNLSAVRAIFSSCYSAPGGGGIYFYGFSMSFDRVCGLDCTTSTSSYDQFFYASCQTTSSSSFYRMSINHCSNTSQIGYAKSFEFIYGSITVSGLNSSFNTIYEHGASFVISSITTLEFSLGNVINNTCSGTNSNCERILYFNAITSGLFEYSNVLYNTNGYNNRGIFFHYSGTTAVLTVSTCVIFGNYNGALFDQSTSASIIAKNCWLDHTGFNTVADGAATTNCTGTSQPFSLWGSSLSFGSVICPIDVCSNGCVQSSNFFTSDISKGAPSLIVMNAVAVVLSICL